MSYTNLLELIGVVLGLIWPGGKSWFRLEARLSIHPGWSVDARYDVEVTRWMSDHRISFVTNHRERKTQKTSVNAESTDTAGRTKPTHGGGRRSQVVLVETFWPGNALVESWGPRPDTLDIRIANPSLVSSESYGCEPETSKLAIAFLRPTRTTL